MFHLEYFSNGQKLWPHSAQAFRDKFESYMRFFNIEHLKMKPYSLRRGGATFLLQEGLPLDCILLRGRWKSLGVARLYLEDGLAQIPQLRVPINDQIKLIISMQNNVPLQPSGLDLQAIFGTVEQSRPIFCSMPFGQKGGLR